jgi:hypothetical protein
MQKQVPKTPQPTPYFHKIRAISADLPQKLESWWIKVGYDSPGVFKKQKKPPEWVALEQSFDWIIQR